MSLPVRYHAAAGPREGDRFRGPLLVREKLVVLAREVQERVGKAGLKFLPYKNDPG